MRGHQWVSEVTPSRKRIVNNLRLNDTPYYCSKLAQYNNNTIKYFMDVLYDDPIYPTEEEIDTIKKMILALMMRHFTKLKWHSHSKWDSITMQHCLKTVILLSVLTLAFVNHNMLSVIIRQARAATVYSDPLGTNVITKIQFPGIIPNDNNTAPLSSSPTSPSTIITPLPPKIRNTRAPPAITGPTLNDPNLKVEQTINRGFDDPTSMAFLGPNDILALEKNTGKVHRILNGKILPEPLIDVNVANEAERGLLGIAIAKNDDASTENGNSRHVFLYYTESASNNNNNIKLTNPKLLLNLPASPPPASYCCS